MITLKKQHRGYAEYKNSDVQWIGKIPKSWISDNLRHCLARNDGGVWGDDFDDEGTIVFRSTEIDESGNWNLEEPVRRKLTESERRIYKLIEGDLLLTKSSGSAQHLGKTALVTKKIEDLGCVYSNFMQRLRVNDKLYPKFLFHLINNEIGRNQINYWSMTTSGLANLSRDLVNKFIFPIPSKDEQQSIASYLDEKCALIDRIIEGKKKQIEILEEQLAAIINRAVTKGLDETVEMKESGVEWIGKMPKIWDIKKLKTLFRFEKGKKAGLFTKEYVGDPKNIGEYPVYSGQTEDEGVMGRINSYIYDLDDTIFTTTVGAKVMTPMVIGGKFSLSQNCVLFIKQNKKIDVRYFYYQLFPMFKWEKDSIPSHMQPSLRVSDLNKYSIAFPAYEEQVEIAHYIEQKTKFIDVFSKEIERSIALLNEYKTSLISHVVTGKVKVS